ncbi:MULTISPECIES: DUF4198 domain-containing protein [unclassified Pseudoalteromonas]|uniref:DUF4198 domain-containing protein n=1 Tax=unclassified Pseudoalteromonas TaxID=194690 RepID=UPI0025B5530D|nr:MULTISPECIES: DUF4198 domain-containing protein [unclassified Pseudoalteromonas]MDN3378655.1 DUF4198 domain-containing protein [Pseudoalteromonas sp. APC 3893]MDN3387144.1 DUF4198 domain-containing protein [Pseudoalteromonas sp. APC 4017]
MKLSYFSMLALTLSSTASAHTLLIKPTQNGQAANIMITEQFFKGDRTLNANKLTTQTLATSGITWLSSNQTQAKVLEYPIATKQSSLIYSTAQPRYRGIKKGEPATTPTKTLRIDDFAKTFIGADPATPILSGQRFEIVPQQHPALATKGSKLQFQVLYKGQPQIAKVSIFPPEGERVRMKTSDTGIFSATITASGTWVVKAVFKSSEAQDVFSGSYEAAASLLFEI